jgi:cytochrome d ubiquinol oxidase subunit II
MLETIWFVLWGVLWSVYFMLDGFDLGLGVLNPFLSKTDADRRVVYNSMGPFWDGNEVWLIAAGGVTFAAFPITYAVMFSSLYTPLLLILFGLILRGVSFEFRGKVDNEGWVLVWDVCHFVGSLVPALLFGIAFANIFQGIPIDSQGVYHGSLFGLLNPYGLLGGALFLFLFLEHGALWLAIKSEGALEERAGVAAAALWWLLASLAILFLASTCFTTHLYANYFAYPALWIIPAVTVAGLVLTGVFAHKKAWWTAWFMSCLTIVGATLFGVAGLYPYLLPSSLDPAAGLTVFNSASSPLTLKIMLGVALTFVPIVIAYQAWGYYMFREKVTEKDLASEEAY